MTKQTEALKLALEALSEIDGSVKLYHRLGPDWTHKDGTEVFEVSVLLDRSELIEKAIAALREALALVNEVDQEQPAQQEQEPVAYAVKTVGGKKWHSIHAAKESSDKWLEYRVKEQAQGETYEQFALYKSSIARRGPLTDDELRAASLRAGMQDHYMGFHSGFIRFARAIEAAHGIKEKNT